MSNRLRRGAIAAVTWLAVMTAAGAGQPAAIDAGLRALFANTLKFSPGDLAALEAGRLVAHTLESSGPGEIGAVGSVQVSAPRLAFIERYRDITQFKKDPNVVQIGRFSNPPVPEDLAPLMITGNDMNLRRCRVHDCDIRLPADAIARFEREIDWSAAGGDQRAGLLFKEILLAHVRAFVNGGPGGLAQFDSDRPPIRPGDSFNRLLSRFRFLGDLYAGLPAHLQAPPSNPLAGAEDFLYWSKEKFGLKPFITVTHVTIVRATPGLDVIASRDVYSSRYLDASLSVTMASDVAGSSDAFLLTYVNRSVTSALKGAFSGLRRAIVGRRAKASIEESLRRVKRRLEAR